MRVILVLNNYLPQSVGGTEMYSHHLSSALLQRGIDVNIVIPRYQENGHSEYEHEGVRVYSYFEPSKSTREIILGLKQPEGLKNFIGLIKDLSPDIAHFHMISSGACITEHHLHEVKKLHIKTCLTVHLSHYTCLTENLLKNNQSPCDGKIRLFQCAQCYLVNKGYNRTISGLTSATSFILSKALNFNNLIYKMPPMAVCNLVNHQQRRLKRMNESLNAWITINRWYRDILETNGIPSKKIYTVLQGLIPMQEQVSINKNNPITEIKVLRLVFLGRISKIKGLHLLLKALAGIAKEHYVLDIYGPINTTDIYYQECQSYIKKYQVNANFKGSIPRELVKSTLYSYDLMVLPSLFSEMAPLVIQEAKAVGLPVLGSNVPGITEQVKHGKTGFIFPFNDYLKLRSQITDILVKPDSLATIKANITPPRNFEMVAEETLIVYNTICNKEQW